MLRQPTGYTIDQKPYDLALVIINYSEKCKKVRFFKKLL